MTAEEYLNAHCKPEDWNNLEESLKDSILTNNVIEHMERYAALCIHEVVERSEQYFCCKEQINQRCSEQCLGCFQFENKD